MVRLPGQKYESLNITSLHYTAQHSSLSPGVGAGFAEYSP